MRTFFDASAFVKRYVEESGSQQVDEICQETSDLALSVICVPEIMSALNRRVRERILLPQAYSVIKQHLSQDIRDAEIVNLTPHIIASAISLLETSPLRAMDALHVACALEWGVDLFVSSDQRQLAAAEKVNLKTKRV
ncbi:MAG: type II toxin-antitoxin system VapC family toxin, partial [Anaerolineales bacterium]|nr:type II toxin-antitoxin system VapC family toxin [Anaerolineales bacterium]